jgi:predicted transcriptional regulator
MLLLKFGQFPQNLDLASTYMFIVCIYGTGVPMKSRRFKICIQSIDESGKEFVKAWKAAARGVEYRPEYDLVLGFPDLSWIARALSPQRLRIIQAVRDKKPESIRQLAMILGRAQQNVQKDVRDLAELGILELRKIRKKGQKRESLRPEFNWDGFDIAV